MKLEEFFKEAKKDYLGVKPPERVSLYGWLELREKLDKRLGLKDVLVWFFVRPALAIALAVVLLVGGGAGLIRAANGSLPGDSLYPVKRTYENIASAVTGNHEIKVEGRANEIIILSQKEEESTERLKEAVIQYQMTVAQVEEKVNEEERKSLKETLRRQKREFERIYEKSRSRDEIKKAIEAADDDEDEEDVKSWEDEHKEEDSRRD
ncbi:hypothetical protein A3E46_00530 [Candidatus Woesebacteria bacterium RIFCSPHIGHO2_12_FULL_46_16]|uniref:DUF5667 domain-containing protein n=1 Tax=Candidatus Woesebacteria bacterium RIFCSPHIGHO2_12_FULL_46_16 TaxID=1802513 RepID=A0A1F8B259_9BACT|nr:MAG: hypothetical protein A3E46_00530 [Candidatus Woesebacteria bacterium RIFCSPHIGHO2_12_FULL_46_16]